MKPKPTPAKSSAKPNGKGRPVSADKPHRLTLNLPLETKRRAYDIAVSRRCSMSRLVEDLLEDCER